MRLFKFVADRGLRKKYIRNTLARQRYHSDRYIPFGYSRSNYKRDKTLAITGKLNKRRSFF